MSVGRRVLVGLYVLAAAVAIVVVFSLWTGVPDLWFEGYEIETLLAATLIVFLVGLLAIVDYLIWPVRRNSSFGVRLMSVAVVAIGFIGGYLLGSRVSVEFRDEGPMDNVASVIGPGDPMLSVAAAVMMACLAAFLVWIGIRKTPADLV